MQLSEHEINENRRVVNEICLNYFSLTGRKPRVKIYKHHFLMKLPVGRTCGAIDSALPESKHFDKRDLTKRYREELEFMRLRFGNRFF